MARFVMASRRAGKFSNQDKTNAVAAFESFADKMVAPAARTMTRASVKKETDRRIAVFEADPVEIATLQRELPGDVMALSARTASATAPNPSVRPAASIWPAGVSAIPRPALSASLTPRWLSNARTCCATAAWVMFSSRPAAE